MRVYRGNSELVDVVIDNRTQMKRALQGEDCVQANFTLGSYFDFKIGDYINWRGKKYTIFKQPACKKIQANQFQFQIDFESDQYRFANAICLLEGQGDFYLLGDFRKFANLIVQNMNRIAGVGYYQLGKVPETPSKNLHFSNYQCLYSIQYLCKEFGKEYVFSDNGRTLDFVDKIGNDTELVFEFRLGLRNIERQKVADKNLVTRLYAFGGERNITNDYGGVSYTGKRLKLPTNYLEQNVDKFGVVEGVVTFDEVYPSRTGVVSAVSTNMFKFKDESLDFDVNGQLIEGVVAKLTFNTGRLAGYEFEVHSYNHNTKEFDIVEYEDTNGFQVPNSSLRVAVGDEYVLHDVKMPQSYVTEAEAELRKKAQSYLDENSLPNVIYSIVPDYPFLRKRLIQLDVGDVVTIRDEDFGIAFQTRIINLTQSLANPYLYTIKVGDKVTVGYITRVLSNQLELENEIKIERYDRTVNYNRLRRNLKNIEELREAVFDPDGYFDADKIKPLSIETKMLSVGGKSQNFLIRNLLIEANYQANPNKTKIGAGTLVHFTIADTIKEWSLTGAIKEHTSSSSHYYIYARCSRTGTGGDFLVTSQKYQVDSGSTYYYFWIGVVHSTIDNVRGVSLTYGQTTINGKFITTGRVQSTDGLNYFDLDGGQFNLGSGESGLDWNVSKSGRLTIRGGLVQSGSDTFPIQVYRGDYVGKTVYNLGDQVTYSGGTYVYTSQTSRSGIVPTNTSYWKVSAQKGTSGKDGVDGKDGDSGPGIVYEGEFKSNYKYKNSSKIRSVVKYQDIYYLYKGIHDRSAAWSGTNWESFGAQFSSIATDLLLADNATIADWIIKDRKITSQNSYEENPRMQFNGEIGEITLIGSKLPYINTGNNLSRRYKQTITISSIEGRIKAEHEGDSYQDGGVAYLDSEGIYANFPGIRTPSFTGDRKYLMGSIVGVGFGKLDKNAYGEDGALVGVFGRARNSSSNPAPAYGGYFLNLFAGGLNLSVVQVNDINRDKLLYETVSLVVGTHSSGRASVYLPVDSPNLEGKVIFLKQWRGGSMRVAPLSSNHILYDDSSPNDYYDISSGWMAMVVFITAKIGGSNKGVWLINKFKY